MAFGPKAKPINNMNASDDNMSEEKTWMFTTTWMEDVDNANKKENDGDKSNIANDNDNNNNKSMWANTDIIFTNC